MLVVQLCCARHCELPLSKMGSKGLFPGVAVPLAFFCTLFFRHRKKSVSTPWDGQSQSAPESARPSPPGGGELRLRAHWGLSSGQTIGAVRTAVRPACCLPELRVAHRRRRVYPLDDGELFKFNLKSSVCQRQTGLPKGNPPCVFPSFPPCTPFGSPSEAIERPIGLQALFPRRGRRVRPRQGLCLPPCPLPISPSFCYTNPILSHRIPYPHQSKKKGSFPCFFPKPSPSAAICPSPKTNSPGALPP